MLREEYYDNTGVEMTDENGTVMSVAKYLEQNGIGEDNGELLDTKEKLEVKKRVLQHYYADKLLSKGNFEGFGEKFDRLRLSIAENLQGAGIKSFGSTTEEDAQKINELRNKKHESSEEDAMMMERLVELTGSVEAADEFIADSKEKGLFDTSQFTDNLERLAPGVFGVFNRDNSVEDDSILNNWVNLKKIKNEGGKFLNAEKLRPGKRRQALNIKIDSPAGEEYLAQELTLLLVK